MKNFGNTAQKLARNPLGIIALFLVLIYGIACLTFGLSKNLPESAPMFFVIFIIVYPLIVLFVFYKLVTKHHTKLYAPQDFTRPEDFLECIYGNQSRAQTRSQIDEAIHAIPTSDQVNITGEADIAKLFTPPIAEENGVKK